MRISSSLYLSLLALLSCRSARPGLHAVVTEPTGFVPARIEVAVGDSVEWLFKGTHNAIFGDRPGKPDDIGTSPEGRYVRIFSVPGRFGYDCTLHPGMTGEVVVGGGK